MSLQMKLIQNFSDTSSEKTYPKLRDSTLSSCITSCYRTHELVYASSQAQQVKAELHRREQLHGAARPYNTNRFNGIFMCGECGYSLNYTIHAQKRAIKCTSRSAMPYRTPHCTQKKPIFLPQAQAYMEGVLLQMLEAKSVNTVFTDQRADDQ